jgi:hypothetical protein
VGSRRAGKTGFELGEEIQQPPIERGDNSFQRIQIQLIQSV